MAERQGSLTDRSGERIETRIKLSRSYRLKCIRLLGFMVITELIKRLEQLRAQVGNVEVEVRNPAGDHDTAEDVQIVNVSRKAGETKWRVYVEA